MVAAGNVIYKVKTGVKPHREDLAHLETMRADSATASICDSTTIRRCKPFGAIKILRDVDSFRPTFIEQPVPRTTRRDGIVCRSAGYTDLGR